MFFKNVRKVIYSKVTKLPVSSFALKGIRSHILDQNGTIRSVKPNQISNRVNQTRVVANDSEGRDLRIDDEVEEVGGIVSFVAS